MELPKLTKSEEEVMQMIWEVGRCTVSELLQRIPEPERPPHSTLSSVVRILEKKGYVGYKAYGKTYEYFPLISKADYGSRSLLDLMRNYFGGSPQRLVSHLVQQEQLDEAELAKLLDKLKD
jgi:BlaI family transcriptional regulator, penicillinase repressor